MALILGAAVALAAPARADDVTVRARTAVQLEVEAMGRRVSLSGSVRDNVFQGLGERVVTFELRPAAGADVPVVRRDVTTDRNGHFAWTGLLEDGDWQIEAFWGGDALHGPAATSASVHVAREAVSLELMVPPASPLWARLPVRIVATHPTIATRGLPVRLALDGQSVREGLVLGDDGAVEVAVERLPGPGRCLVEASVLGNHVFAPEVASATVQLYAEAALGLASRVEVLHDARLLALTGSLESDAGPLVDLPVHFAVEGSAIEGEGRTDEAGRFRQALPIDALEEDVDWVVHAWVDPQGTPIPDMRLSAESTFQLEAGPLASAGRWASVLAATLVLAIGIGLAAGRVRAWLEARRRARERAMPPGRAAPRGLVELAPRRPGAPADQTRVTGRVRDADTALPVGAGTVRARLSESADADERVFPVATDGSFSTAPLAAGDQELRVEASGYVSTRLEVSIPHRGRFTDIDVYLCSVRSWVRYLYQQMSLGLQLASDGSHHWGRATPRQLESLLIGAYRAFVGARGDDSGLDAFREGLGTILDDPSAVPSDRVLRALTLLIEEVYYSSRLYSEDLVNLCRSLVDGVEETVAASADRAG